MTKLFFVVCFLSLSLFASAADTTTVTSRTGNCSVSVPASWTVESTIGGAHSADNKVSLVVSSPTHGLNSIADVEENAPTIYKDDKVTKKSSSEFEMEGKSISGKPNVYRAIPAGGKVCIVEITYESGSAADAKAIAETMKAK
jgi:hypothetical protein